MLLAHGPPIGPKVGNSDPQRVWTIYSEQNNKSKNYKRVDSIVVEYGPQDKGVSGNNIYSRATTTVL